MIAATEVGLVREAEQNGRRRQASKWGPKQMPHQPYCLSRILEEVDAFHVKLGNPNELFRVDYPPARAFQCRRLHHVSSVRFAS